MSTEAPPSRKPTPTSAVTPAKAPASAEPTPLFRRIDWLTMALVFVVVMTGYWFTLAPDLTLEDSGELAVASFYAGIPHPPGYPFWTLYTWVWANFLPVSNIAWRVALGGAFAGALACGLLGLIVSRGSSMMIEGIELLKGIDRKIENAICVVSGFVAGCLIAFNGYMWSQAVIVEVYSLSILSMVLVLVFLLRFIYAPHQKRYAYWAFFIFGICFTNHQSLLVMAMGIQVCIAAANWKLGRALFFWNSVLYLLGLVGWAAKLIFQNTNPMIFFIFNVVGILSILAYIWFAFVTEQAVGREEVGALAFGGCWAAGAAFYLWMPIAGMSTPPMQWGYPRTVEGFIHALTRGQYEKANPSDLMSLAGWERYFGQLWQMVGGVAEEFNWVYLLIALIPFLFFRQMQKRERAWVIGIFAIYLCLGPLLVVLFNPSMDRQSRDLLKVFFTAGHVCVAMGVGYGLTLIAASLATHYQRFRVWAIVGGALAAVIAFVSLIVTTNELFAPGQPLASLGQLFRFMGSIFQPDQYGMPVLAGMILLALALGFLAVVFLRRDRPALGVTLAIFTLMPAWSAITHWSDNEQRGHLFGYWFGHDMFTPPFVDSKGEFSYDAKERELAMQDPARAPFTYPEMSRDAVLYGGTDPGRFCPTYMIFCESFIPPRCKPRDPAFDRRDVYIITQNALADGTYLNYIRSHYNKSAQIQYDTPFFQELLRPKKEREWNYSTNAFARLAYNILDRPLLAIGERIEKNRRARGVYPPKEIYIASPEDSQKCFNDYLLDAQRRLQLNQLRPGEDVRVVGGRVQVSGQVAVMAINGLLTKVMFDKNPDHEFYVEESFPLEWMFPHLTPFGVIMKINREPLPELSEEILARDHAFWRKYSERLIGDWITYDTPVSEVVAFIEKTYLRRNFAGFTGDRKFIRDDQAQKAFSKLRSSIGGIYAWRLGLAAGAPTPPQYLPKTPAEQARLTREADFAFKQAFAFCPYSPEAVFRYMQLLAVNNRLDDAILVLETALKLDPYNGPMAEQLKRLKQYQKEAPRMTQQLNELQTNVQRLRKEWESNPNNFQAGLDLANSYVGLGQTPAAVALMEQMLASPGVTADAVVAIAQYCVQASNFPLLEKALQRLSEVSPNSPEAWYDLAAVKAATGKAAEALPALRRAFELADRRLKTNAAARNLRTEAGKDPRFDALRQSPEFKQIMSAL
jgi:Flp pilus assembly protein TadD